MAAAVDAADTLSCSICLDLFKNPVTTSCGHNFCKSCITVNWDLNYPYECPLCKERFYSQPSLKTNTLLAGMVSNIESMRRAQAGPGEVPCDVCPEPRQKAQRSCLSCVASYCESHLKPYQTVLGLKTHELINPVQNLKSRVCSKHNAPFRKFCQTDQRYICCICSLSDHRGHKIVTLEEVYQRKKSLFLLTQTKNQKLVKQRRKKIQDIERSVELSQRVSESEVAAGQKAFTALIESVQSSLNQLLEEVHEKQNQTKKRAQDLVQKLEQEISELEKRSSEVEQLLCSEDHFNLITCTSLPPIEVKDWSCVSFEAEALEGRASQLLSELKELINAQINRKVLEGVQQFAVDVSLDPSTAHANLTLSDNLKQVHHTDTRKKCPGSTHRFSDCTGVLGMQSFTSAKFYFEVQVKEKTEWDIGVALETVSREGSVRLHPDSGFWSVALRGASAYFACTGARLFLKSAPLDVGVFVDYGGGQVDFYDVHTADLIHSFSGYKFTQKLLPFFSPGHNCGGTNAAPLVLKAAENLRSPPKKHKH